jgi:tape measure domain-containing protein
MTDTSLNIEVKTSGVNQAAADLQKLSTAASSTEKSTSGMVSGIDRVNAQLKAMGDKSRYASEEASKVFNDLVPGAKRAETAIQKVAKSFDDAGKSASGFSSGAKDVAKGGVAVLALAKAWELVAGSIGDAIKAADDYTRIDSRLRQVTGGVQGAVEAQAALFKIAQDTRQPFIELANTYAQVARSTEDLNLGQTRLLGVTKTISQAVSLSGSSTQSANAAMIQFSQAMASGVLRGEELNSIMEQTPRLAKAIADGMGIGIGELRKLGQEGELTAEKVLGAIEKSAKNIENEFRSMTPTVADGFTKLANSAGNFIDVINDATGASKALYKVLASLSSAMDFTAKGVKQGVANAQTGVLEAKVASLQNQLANLGSGDFRRSGIQQQLDAAQSSLFKQRGANLAGGADAPVLPFADGKAQKQTQAEIDLWNKLNGVSSSYSKELKTLFDQYSSGKMGVDEYRKSVAKLIDIEIKGEKKIRSGGSRKSNLNAGEDTAAAKAYEQALKSIEKAQLSAEQSGLDLTASQKVLFDLMNSAEWQRMPDTWKQVVVAQTAAAVAAEELAKYNKAVAEQTEANRKANEAQLDTIAALERETELYGLSASAIANVNVSRLEEARALAEANGAWQEHLDFLDEEIRKRKELAGAYEKNDVKRILANTPTERAKKAEADKATLDRALAADEISKKAYEEGLKEIEGKTKDAVDSMDEFTKQAARNMQDAMADFFINPTKDGMQSLATSFAQTIQKMIAQAGSAQLMNILFGDMGKSGNVGGLAKDAIGFFAALMSANGNAFSSNGVHAFATGGAFGNGEILTKPTVFRFSSGGSFRTGVAGEAGPEGALPLKRMSNGKLGVYMQGGGGQVINMKINAGSGVDKAEIRRAAAAGARGVLAVANGARRYG